MKRSLASCISDSTSDTDGVINNATTDITDITVIESILPLDVWRVIVGYVGLHLLFHPVCQAWLQTITTMCNNPVQCEQLIQEWIADMADGHINRNETCISEHIVGDRYDLRGWCRALRGIPNVVDLEFCRDLQRIINGRRWLNAHRVMPRKGECLLDDIYLLWKESEYELRVIGRSQFNHLLSRWTDEQQQQRTKGIVRTDEEEMESTPVPVDDHMCTDRAIHIDGSVLGACPLSAVKQGMLGELFRTRPLAGNARHCIKTIEDYQRMHNNTQFVYVNRGGCIHDAHDVVRYLVQWRDWDHLCTRVTADYQHVVRLISPETLNSIWLAHCAKFADATERSYREMKARDEKHWVLADDQMASDVCEMMRHGLLLVDARGTRVHAPQCYSEEELVERIADEDDEMGLAPLRAYARLYAPHWITGKPLLRPMKGTFVVESRVSDGFHIDIPTMNDNGEMYQHHIKWPYMHERSNQIEWEKETYGLNRLTSLLYIDPIEVVDIQVDRPDGYLFSALASRAF